MWEDINKYRSENGYGEVLGVVKKDHNLVFGVTYEYEILFGGFTCHATKGIRYHSSKESAQEACNKAIQEFIALTFESTVGKGGG